MPVICGVPLNELHELPMSYQEGNFFREFRATVSPSGLFEDIKNFSRNIYPSTTTSRKSAIERMQGISMFVSPSLMTVLENLATQTQQSWMTSHCSTPLARQRKSKTREEFFAWQGLGRQGRNQSRDGEYEGEPPAQRKSHEGVSVARVKITRRPKFSCGKQLEGLRFGER